jgi:hypothetical protein
VIGYRWALPLVNPYEEPVATDKILFAGLRHLFSLAIHAYTGNWKALESYNYCIDTKMITNIHETFPFLC